MADGVVNVQVNAIGNFGNVIGEVGKLQSRLQNLKLPKNLGGDAAKGLTELQEKFSNLQNLANKGIKTKADFNNFEKAAKEVDVVLKQVEKSLNGISNKKIKLNITDSDEIKKKIQELERFKQEAADALNLKNLGTNKVSGIFNIAEIDKIKNSLKEGSAGAKNLQNAINSFRSGNIDQVNAALNKLVSYAHQYEKTLNDSGGNQRGTQLLAWAKEAQAAISGADAKIDELNSDINQMRVDQFNKMATGVESLRSQLGGLHTNISQATTEMRNMARSTMDMHSQLGNLQTQANYFFGLQNMFQLFKRNIQETFDTVKQLDAAMTETAVVTDYSVSDMWGKLPLYTQTANELGATIKGAYETMTLYYQQGLNTEEAFAVGTETMKMARIAGLDYAQTTNMMTAALRGFNMEINNTSAKRVNDVYSELAAVTASDTRELGLAMERTASIAHSANMDFGNTTAFLAQMIETTREAPENLGTAMKTIIARFQELKENPYQISEVEGEEVDFNRVDKALKSIGVDLMDNRDKFRDLDDVFLDISERWDGLSQTQQRYIATIAAGARQQSRFLAMVGNYDRLKQLTDAAANSAGASDVQFAKTLDSMEAKLNKLRNAWDQFAMGIANNQLLKGAVDFGVKALDTINEIENKIEELAGGFGTLGGSVAKSITSLTALWAAFKVGGKIVDTSIGVLGSFLGVTKVKGAGLLSGVSGQRSAAGAAQAAAIYNPIVNAINNAAARITNSENSLGQQLKTNYSKNFNRQDFRNSQRALRFEDGKKLLPSGKYGRIKNRTISKEFTGLDVTNQLKKYSGDQQRILMQQVPGTRAAIERSYQEATKKLNLNESATNAVTQLRSQISQEMMKPGGMITPEAGMNLMGNPRQLARLIDDEGIRQELLNKTRDIRKGFLKEAKAKGIGKDKTGAEKYRALKNYALEKEAQIYNPTTQLTEKELRANKFAGFTAGATAAGQAVMNLGMALDGLGLHAIGGALTSIGSTMTSIGLAASSAVTGVTALNTALKGIGISLGPLLAVSAGVAALGVAASVAYKKQQDKIKEIRKEAKEIATTYNDTIDQTTANLAKLNDYRTDFEKLSKGVDINGNNVSLGAEEYNDYLKIVKEITDMHPELIKGYSAQGNIIVDNNSILREAIKLEQKQQEEAKKTFTSQESINKMALARSTTKRWKVGQNSIDRNIITGKTVQHLQGSSQLNTDFQKLIDSIGQLENGEEILSNLANTYDLTIEDFKTGTKEAIQAVNSYGGDMLGYIKANSKDASEELLTTINDDIAKIGKDYSGMEEVSKGMMDSLLLYAGEKGYTERIHSSLQGVFSDAVKDIVLFEDPENMLSSVDNIGKEFSTLDGHLEEYNKILETVEEAQTQFGKDLNLNKYNTSIDESIEKIEDWKATWDEGTDSTSKALSEWAENQIEVFRDVSNGTVELADAFNEMSGRITSANSSYENWTKRNEDGDLYTASDNFKKMLEEVNDGVDDLGKGSQQWWTAAQSMFGDDYVLENSKEKIQSHMSQVKNYLKEGQEGVDNFMIDLRDNKLGKELDKDILGVKKNGAPYTIGDFIKVDENGGINFDKLGEAPDEAFSAVAKALGLSDDLFTSLLNKARQFGDIKFGNIDQMRTALATGESTIVGKGSTNGNKNIYVRESDFNTQALEAGLRSDEIKEYKKELQNLGTIFMDSASSINKGQLSKYIEDWGIKTGKYETSKGEKRFQTTTDAFIRYLDKANYNKDEIQQMYETATNGKNSLITDVDKVDFNEAYETAKEENADPSFQAINSIEGNVGSILGVTESIAAAMGIVTQRTKNQVTEGTKTANEHIDDLVNGNPDISFSKAKSNLEADVASLKETKSALELGQSQYEQGTPQWNEFQSSLAKVNSSLSAAEAALNTTTKTEYEAAQAHTQIANFANGAGGQSALRYYNQNGFGNTDLQSRNSNLIDWGKDPTKNSNFKNAQTWGYTAEDLKGQVSSFLSTGMGFGEGENAIEIAFTPILDTGSGLEMTAQEDVESYLKQIVEKATDAETGKIDVEKLMGLDQEGLEVNGQKLHDLIMGTFEGEDAAAASNAFGQLEHILSEGMIASDTSFDGLKQAAQDANILGQNLASTGVQGQQTADELTTSFLKLNQEGLSKLSDEEFNSVITSLGKTRGEVEAIAAFDPTINLGIESDTTQLDKTEDQIQAEEDAEHAIPVEVEVQNEGNQSTGGLIDKATSDVQKGASQTITTPFVLDPTIENPEAVSAEGIKKEANVPNSLPAQTIIANYVLKAKVDSAGAKESISKKAKSSGKGVSGGAVSTKATMDSRSFDSTAKKVDSKIKTLNGRTIKPKLSVTDNASSTINSVSSDLSKLDGKTANTKIVTTKIERKAERGLNNHIPHQSIPKAGSAAKGSQRGTVGPKNKGGLTLTGEKGFEIAWIPSENRSMILGAEGPQMVNLPNDAVVWTNKQSKKILKQKSIPAGSSWGGTYVPGSGSTTGTTGGTTVTKPKPSSRKYHEDSNDKKAAKENKKNRKKQGKIILWWWDMTKKVEATQRRIDQLSKKLEKGLKVVGASLESVAPTVSKYLKDINLEKKYSEQMRDYAQEKLTRLATGTSDKKQAKIEKAREKVQKAQERYNKQATKENKEKLKKSKKELKRTKKSGVEYSKVSYKKGKKTKKKKVNLSKFIKYDEESGAYIVDYEKINDTYKSGSLRKAVGKAATSKLEKWQGNYNTADDNFIKAQEELEELSQQLYDTFHGWENELTNLWELTKKIEQVQNKISRNEAFTNLLDAQLKSGQINTDSAKDFKEFIDKYNQTFKTGIELQVDKIKEQSEVIKEQQLSISKSYTGEDITQTLDKVNEKLGINKKIENYESVISSIENSITDREELIKELEVSKTNLEAEISGLDAQIENTEKTKKKNALIEQKEALISQKKGLEVRISNENRKLGEDRRDLNDYEKDLQNIVDLKLGDEELLDYTEYQKQLEDQLKIANRAKEYMNPQLNADGTVNFNFDQTKLEEDKFNGDITSDDYEKVKKYIEDLIDNSNNLEESITTLTDSLTDLYESLSELNEQWVDYSTDLLSYYEDVQQNEIEKLTALSNSINNTLKNLLDKVKKNLDERRKQEDNAKTQTEISQKQQRLSALRADTAGGHQAEIAQLEKEIADSQRDYGRTLEDQQLERLQNSADEAAAQRERQISLLEELNTSVNNAAQVNEWMNNPDKYKSEIKAAFYNKEGYDEAPWVKQEQIEKDFKEFWAQFTTNRTRAALVEEGIQATEEDLAVVEGLRNALIPENLLKMPEAAEGLTLSLYELNSSINELNKTMGGTPEDSIEDPKVNEPTEEGAKLLGVDLSKTASNIVRNATDKALDASKTVVDNFVDSLPSIATTAAKGVRSFLGSLGIHYDSGGLANFTGPAWLDGTPSKPELVLNSTDTKNFLALRDVLSNSMGSINSSNESITNNAAFEININVDHINNDYDVDRIAERIKKDIIKTAGYRNTTQVRNFR